jgi:hypothetical protein
MLSMQVRYFQVDRRNLAYLKFIIEAYEGMAIMSTVERKGAIVSISSPACFSEDIDHLLTAITAEIPMTESAYPGHGTVFQNGEDSNA